MSKHDTGSAGDRASLPQPLLLLVCPDKLVYIHRSPQPFRQQPIPTNPSPTNLDAEQLVGAKLLLQQLAAA